MYITSFIAKLANVSNKEIVGVEASSDVNLIDSENYYVSSHWLVGIALLKVIYHSFIVR